MLKKGRKGGEVPNNLRAEIEGILLASDIDEYSEKKTLSALDNTIKRIEGMKIHKRYEPPAEMVWKDGYNTAIDDVLKELRGED